MKILRGTSVRAALIAVAAVGLVTNSRAASLISTNGTAVAYITLPAPGTNGAMFSTMDNPMVAEDGTVYFRATVAGGDVISARNSRGLFMGTSTADVSMIARWGDAAPGLPGLSLISASNGQGPGELRISPDGRTMWTTFLDNASHNLPSTADTAIYAGFPGSLTLVAREGDVAPGTGGAVFASTPSGQAPLVSIQSSAINRNGVVAFPSMLAGAGVTTANDTAIFTGTPGLLSVMARKGDTMLNGVTAADLASVLMDDNRRVIYFVTLAGTGVTTANDMSLWLYTPGSGSTLLVREGQAAPGTNGATFGNAFGNAAPTISPTGLTVNGLYDFTIELIGGDVVTGQNDQAFYVGNTSGTLTLVARKGDPAPGTDGFFKGINGVISNVNSSGSVIFMAQLTGGTADQTNDEGIWLGTPTGIPAHPYTLTLINRGGDPAPGTAGAVFDNTLNYAQLFNDLGQAVFIRSLVGGDVTSGVNDHSMYAWDAIHGLFQIIRSGDPFQPTPDLTLTPFTFGFLQFSNAGGSQLSLNKHGILAINPYFNEGGAAVMSVDLNCYPPSPYYPDLDGDGYGDAAAAPISVCANAQVPAGYVADHTDCNDADATVHPGATETCNGVDDNCDGLVDNGITAPAGSLTMKIARSGPASILSWLPNATASAYDLVTGDLQELRTKLGNYATLTQASCLVNDNQGTTFATTASPNAGKGFWYLVRPENCGGVGTYDSGAPSQHSSRDAGIQAGGYACP